MRGKLIVIEGIDCSGKETQAKLLEKSLKEKGYKVKYASFPNYETPTGKIIASCYLGKKDFCCKYLKEDKGWFGEKSSEVDSLVSSLYYAADRKYNIKKILDLLSEGVNVILDRYTFSNMAYQGGKIAKKEERLRFFKKIECLEFDILELPKPDLVVLLYIPYQKTLELQKKRGEIVDQNEADGAYLERVSLVYLELRDRYHFEMIEELENDLLREVRDINGELEKMVKEVIDKS